MMQAGAGTKHAPVLALDVGGTQIRAAVVTPDGAIHARKARRTPVDDGPDAVVAACSDTLRESLKEFSRSAHDAAATEMAGISISSPGPLDPWRGVILDTPNLGPSFQDVPIAERIERALGLPTYLERDTQVAALAEGTFGAARGTRDFLYITVSSGVGGAIVTEGRLLMGPDGTAGELGHVVIDFHGPPCGCGGTGHLESFSAGAGIARAARQAIGSGHSVDLEEYARKIGLDPAVDHLDARQVAEAEDDGVASARQIMEDARQAFAAACVGFVDVFDPDLIVVGGSVARGQGERLLEPAREMVQREAFKVPAARVRIVPGALGDDVGLVGGLVLVHTRMDDDRWRGGRPPIDEMTAPRATADAPTTSAATAGGG
jgi:glucokinase